VEPGALPCHIAGPAAQPDPQSGPELLAFLERCRGNVSAAARLAGIDRSTFYRRLHRAGLMDRRQG